MIPANKTTIPETAYSLAIEAAEGFAKRYHRLAFWVPFLGREFQIKAKMWDYTAERLRKHAQYLGPKRHKAVLIDPCKHLSAINQTMRECDPFRGPNPMLSDMSIPARPSMADNVGFGE